MLEKLTPAAALLDVIACGLDLASHDFRGKAILPVRHWIAENISPLVADSIGNWGRSAAIMATAMLLAEGARKSGHDNLANFLEVMGFISVVTADALAESFKRGQYILPMNTQAGPDFTFGLAAGIVTYVLFKGAFDHRHNMGNLANVGDSAVTD